MKKRLIIFFAIAALLVLIAIPVYHRVDKALDERQRYAIRIGHHFSAKVDSLTTFWLSNGYVYFHPTRGEVDLSNEDRAAKELKFNGYLRFIFDADGPLAFHARDLDKYQLDDSLVINSDVGKIFIYRHGKLAAESDIWKDLNGI